MDTNPKDCTKCGLTIDWGIYHEGEVICDDCYTDCPCGDPSNHPDGDLEGCTLGAIIKNNI